MATTTPSVIPETRARLAAHWAANVPASVASHLLTPEPDYGHTALRWRDGLGLVSASIDGMFRVGLSLEKGEVFVARDAVVVASFSLDAQTLQDAIDRLAVTLFEAGGAKKSLPVPLLDLTRPPHVVAEGAGFEVDLGQWSALSNWFGFAARRLERERAQHDTASALRCWPHHFDIGALWTLDEEPDPEKARSVGIGLSPGDELISDPYFYVLPWPKPEARPSLPVGSWEGGFMVLEATEILSGDPVFTVDRFLGEVSSIATELVSGGRAG
ncbi:MAG: hypothetical protein AAGD10_14835 [Myxococcota bacterium]